jgi:hypothetical protein
MRRPECRTPWCDRDAFSVLSPRYRLHKTRTCKGAGVPPGAAANSAPEYGQHRLEKRVAGDVSRFAVPSERLAGRRVRFSTIATVASGTSKPTETSIDMFGLLLGFIKLRRGFDENANLSCRCISHMLAIAWSHAAAISNRWSSAAAGCRGRSIRSFLGGHGGRCTSRRNPSATGHENRLGQSR